MRMRRALVVLCVAGLAAPASAQAARFSLVQASPSAAFSLQAAGARAVAPRLGIWRLPTPAAERLAPRLRAAGALRLVEPERTLVSFARAAPLAGPLPATEWWLVAVGAAGLTTPGPGKPVVEIDSGVDVSTPTFFGRPNTTMLNAQTTGGVDEDHGTEVGSVIAAPSAASGVVGVYPDAVFDSWDASPSSFLGLTDTQAISGIEQAAALGPAVINLSWGAFAPDPLVEVAVESAFKAGSLIVAAAGNARSHRSPPAYPASYAHVLSVGATDENDVVTSFSSASESLDLVAPGQDIVAADPQSASGLSTVDGTSFASPLVAGIAAWVWTARPTLDNTQLFQLLRRSATDLGSAGWDPDYGYGLVNLPAALAAATPPTDPQEPNEDVSEVRPGGDLGAAGNPVLAPGTISASIDAAGDPRDVYRIALPAGRKVTVRLSTGGLVLSIWGPKTTTVDERGAARRRDLLGSGKTTATARGVGDVGYVEVSLGSGTRAKAYRLTVSTR